MKYFREEHINMLCDAMVEDEFEELEQYGSNKFAPAFQPIVEFVWRNLYPLSTKERVGVLDVGCGSGASFSVLPVTHGIEPNKKRYELALQRVKQLKSVVVVEQGFAEALPFETNGTFGTIFMINTFNHVRSEFETLIEVNRNLRSGGRFIFNMTGDEVDVYAGRAGFAIRNWRRLFRDFGFEFIEYRELKSQYVKRKEVIVTDHTVCVEKVEKFNPENLRKMQLVRLKAGGYRINNLFLNGRDWRLK